MYEFMFIVYLIIGCSIDCLFEPLHGTVETSHGSRAARAVAWVLGRRGSAVVSASAALAAGVLACSSGGHCCVAATTAST